MTKFGILLKLLRVGKGNFTQDALAGELDYSSSYLSAISNGKAEPEMDFLIKCINYFKLNKEETINFIFTAFSSCNKKLVLDVSYFTGKRKEQLIKAITTLLLMPDFTVYDQNKARIEESIEDMYEILINSFIEVKEFT
ncbi:MAG: helix-turn-helix domain-containing protein [Spirochaetaceae bacterium]|nr:helix-turn-helix domain-containing protein [Spirochaetaceae bacterium]